MTISLDKLQDLFALRLEYSSKLIATERQIRCAMGDSVPEAGETEAPKRRARKPASTPETEPVIGDTSSPTSVAPPSSDFLTTIGKVILSQMNPGTSYSKAELFQIALDASGEGTDAEQLKIDVGNSVREMVADGFLTKSGEAKGTRYTKA